MTTNMLFGTLLKELRNQKNLKLIDLATQMGMDKGLLSKIENNERRATKEQVEKLVQILDVNPKMLHTSWLASKIIYELEDQDYGLEALMVAEQIVKYNAIKSESLEDLEMDLIALKNQLDTYRPIPALQLENLINAYKIDYTFESNRIEGNTLTLQETALVVEKGLTINGKSMREHLEAINHAEAIDFITDLVKYNTPFTERILLQIHSLVLRGIDKENAGRYRSIQVRIGGSTYLPPAPYLIQKQMEEYFLFYEANINKMHPIVLAADMHEKLVTIHPFIDGNGRTSRLVMNLIALQNGYPIINISGEKMNRMDYYNALEQVQVHGNNKAFRLLVANYSKASLNEWIKLCS